MRVTWRTRYALSKMARWCVAHRSQIHYAEVRPIPYGVPFGRVPWTSDCSGFVSLLAKWAGLPDPNGANFDGSGFTGTLLTHLPHIPRRSAKRGDLVVFGGYPGVHVVMLLQNAGRFGDPLVASHGQESDPNVYHLSDEINFFGSGVEVTYLRIAR